MSSSIRYSGPRVSFKIPSFSSDHEDRRLRRSEWKKRWREKEVRGGGGEGEEGEKEEDEEEEVQVR